MLGLVKKLSAIKLMILKMLNMTALRISLNSQIRDRCCMYWEMSSEDDSDDGIKHLLIFKPSKFQKVMNALFYSIVIVIKIHYCGS